MSLTYCPFSTATIRWFASCLYSPLSDVYKRQVVHNDAHKAGSMKAALESIVLLKNENQMLPLSKNFKKIAVMGPNGEEVKELTCRYGACNVLLGSRIVVVVTTSN